MIKAALEYLLQLKRPETVNVGECVYSTLPLTPVKYPSVRSLEIHTLTGLADYLGRVNDNVEDPGLFDFLEIESIDQIFIHVLSHSQVDLYGTLMGPWHGRHHYISAHLIDDKPFPFGRWLGLEEAIIELQSKMVHPEHVLPARRIDVPRRPMGVEAIPGESALESALSKSTPMPVVSTSETAPNDLLSTISLLSTVTECTERVSEDTGISQLVTVKKGARGKDNEEISSIVSLVPYRTFREIEQPTSLFVRRIRQGSESPQVAFFEADGGGWRLEAIQKIKDWLSKNIPGVKIIA